VTAKHVGHAKLPPLSELKLSKKGLTTGAIAALGTLPVLYVVNKATEKLVGTGENKVEATNLNAMPPAVHLDTDAKEITGGLDTEATEIVTNDMFAPEEASHSSQAAEASSDVSERSNHDITMNELANSDGKQLPCSPSITMYPYKLKKTHFILQ